MKRTLLLFAILQVFLAGHAENSYDSFLTEGKVWAIGFYGSKSYGDYLGSQEEKLVGDTVIDGIRFREIYDRNFSNRKGWQASSRFLGEQDRKVYLHEENMGTLLVMDFTMKEGDIINGNGEYPSYRVTAVSDTILLGSSDFRYRKCLYVSEVNAPERTDVWIEGIGSLEYGMNVIWLRNLETYPNLMRCAVGDNVLHLAEEGLSESVNIDGLNYVLSHVDHVAAVENGNTWTGEMDIPENVTNKDEEYTVTVIQWLAFDFCNTLTKVRIPKTVTDIRHYYFQKDCKNPFRGCTSLESIEVDKENPAFCSVDGVLFNKDKTELYCYPAGAKREEYAVHDGVTWIGGDAFAYNPYLAAVTMPNSVTHLGFDAFSGCTSLKSVKLSDGITFIAARTFEKCESLKFLEIPASVSSFAESVFRWSPIETILIRGTFPNGLRSDTFDFMDKATVIYVQQSEVDKFKARFIGSVLPLESYHGGNAARIASMCTPSACLSTYDLQGRRLTVEPQQKGVYIRGGRKYVRK